jgi:hypothetical protein
LAPLAKTFANVAGDRAVFLCGFAKNERDNIDDDELATLEELAAGWLVPR